MTIGAGVKMPFLPMAGLDRSVRFENFRFDPETGELERDDALVVRLQEQPCRVLEALMSSAGRLVTRDALADALADPSFDSHRLDSLVYRLRRKVADGCGTHLPLEAIHGEGYMLDTMR